MFTNKEMRNILTLQLKLNADHNKPNDQINIARECIKLNRTIYIETKA